MCGVNVQVGLGDLKALLSRHGFCNNKLLHSEDML